MPVLLSLIVYCICNINNEQKKLWFLDPLLIMKLFISLIVGSLTVIVCISFQMYQNTLYYDTTPIDTYNIVSDFSHNQNDLLTIKMDEKMFYFTTNDNNKYIKLFNNYSDGNGNYQISKEKCSFITTTESPYVETSANYVYQRNFLEWLIYPIKLNNNPEYKSIVFVKAYIPENTSFAYSPYIKK